MPHRGFKTNQTNERVFLHFGASVVLVGVLLFISSASVKAAWDMYQTFDTAAASRSATELELAALKEEHNNMKVVLAQFGTERGLEATVRERFGVVRPGEGEIRIVRAEPGSAVTDIQNSNPFSRLINALFAW